MNPPRLSIVVISFNCWELLDVCLRSIYASSFPAEEIELIVVDNASVDGSPRRLREGYPRAVLLENRENIGHPRAVNQGISAARGEMIMVLDADTEFRGDAIANLMAFLTGHPQVSMVAPRTLNHDGTIQETARNFPGVMNGLFGRQSLLSRWFPDNRFTRSYLRREELDSASPYMVEFVSAACMLFRRQVLTTIGKWDEDYQGYWVDADWCMRFKEHGEKIYCVPGAVIVHHEQNKAFKRKSPKRIINFHMGVLRFYRLHHTLGYADPRFIAAAILLAVRTSLLLLVNAVLSGRRESGRDPLSMKK